MRHGFSWRADRHSWRAPLRSWRTFLGRPFVAAMCVLLAGVLGLLGVLSATGPARADSPSVRHSSVFDASDAPVLVVGFTGVDWGSLSRDTTPGLAGFAQHAASANVVTRALGEPSCAVAGWLTLSAGERALAPSSCDESYSPSAAARAVKANAPTTYAAPLGTLLRGRSDVELVGPNAAWLLAGAGIQQPTTQPGKPSLGPAGIHEAVFNSSARLIVVDAGNAPAAPTSASASARKDRADALAAIDDRVSAAISGARPGTRVVLINVASAAGDPEEHLGYAAFGIVPKPGAVSIGGTGVLATSNTTRTDGLVALTDVAPTLAVMLGGSPDAAAPISATSAVSSNQTPALLADADPHSRMIHQHYAPIYAAWAVIAVLVALAGAWRVLRRRYDDGLHGWVQLATFTAALPLATMLVNVTGWWRARSAVMALWAGVVLIAALVAGFALLGRTVRAADGKAELQRDDAWVTAPLVRIAGVNGAVLLLDTLIAGLLHRPGLVITAVRGGQPTVGGRFYGVSNPVFALIAAGMIVWAAFLGERAAERFSRRVGGWVVLGVGLATVLIDGLPTLGADFGGPPALVVGFGLLALYVWRTRFTWWKVAIVLAAGAASSPLIGLLDSSGSTHLGRFMRGVEKGRSSSWAVVERKLSEAFFGAPPALAVVLAVVIVAALVAGALWLRRHVDWGAGEPGRRAWARPAVRGGVTAAAVALVIGSLINDASVMVLVMGLSIIVPVYYTVVERQAVVDGLPAAGAGPAEDDELATDDEPVPGDDPVPGQSAASGESGPDVHVPGTPGTGQADAADDPAAE